jgi:hypothetical protein
MIEVEKINYLSFYLNLINLEINNHPYFGVLTIVFERLK